MATVKQYHFTEDTIVEEALPIPTAREVKDYPPILATFHKVNETLIRPRLQKIEEQLAKKHISNDKEENVIDVGTGTNGNHQ
jgi:hypothetical protein